MKGNVLFVVIRWYHCSRQCIVCSESHNI